MDTQNLTDTNTSQGTELDVIDPLLIKAQQEQFIIYMAIGGLLTEETDEADKVQEIRHMPVTEFCQKVGISRDTFYRWKKLPGISETIRSVRNQVFGLNRETALHNRAYLIAMTSRDHKAAGEMIKMLLGNSGKLELPVQRQEIKNEGESWTSLVERKQRELIEAEIVNDPQVREHDRPSNNA